MQGEGEQNIIYVFSIPAFYLCLVNLILLTDLVHVIELRTSFSFHGPSIPCYLLFNVDTQGKCKCYRNRENYC